MSIDFIPYRLMSNNAWVCPLDDMDAIPNFANGNAAEILDELGFGSEKMWEAAPVTIDLFESAVVLAITGLDGKASQPIGPRITRGDGPTMIDCGRSYGYMNRRLDDLLNMVKLGRAAGATHVGWG